MLNENEILTLNEYKLPLGWKGAGSEKRREGIFC